MFGPESLRQALDLLGTTLADRQEVAEIVVIGGGALQLVGVIRRPTKDLDALAIVKDDQYRLARPLPDALREAVSDVANVLGLEPDWLNPGPTDQLAMGLPPGFKDRTTTEIFGGLTLHLAGRFDQICFKLFAAADQDRKSKHVVDLLDLDPTADERSRAAAWVKEQDASPIFARFVDQVLAYLEEQRASR